MALNSEQTALIQAGASAVPSRWRPRFLAVVAAQLHPYPHPNTGDVVHAMRVARRAICIGISPISMS
jgi:hypothetical protein